MSLPVYIGIFGAGLLPYFCAIIMSTEILWTYLHMRATGTKSLNGRI